MFLSLFSPLPSLFPPLQRSCWCLSLDLKFIRGRFVLPPARCSAAVPFNCTVRFSACLGMNAFFYAAGLIYGSVFSPFMPMNAFFSFLAVNGEVLWSHMWIFAKRKFFITWWDILSHIQRWWFICQPWLLFFMNKQALECSLFHFYVTLKHRSSFTLCPTSSFFLPIFYPVHQLLSWTILCNYERSSPFSTSRLRSSNCLSLICS